MLLVDLVEVELEVNLASNMVAFSLPRLELEPAVISMFVLDEVGAESDVSKESLAI